MKDVNEPRSAEPITLPFIARDYCKAAGIAIPQNNAHFEVRRCLENNSQALLADDLRNLHDLRKCAGYDVSFPFADLTRSTTVALASAQSILARLAQLVP